MSDEATLVVITVKETSYSCKVIVDEKITVFNTSRHGIKKARAVASAIEQALQHIGLRTQIKYSDDCPRKHKDKAIYSTD